MSDESNNGQDTLVIMTPSGVRMTPAGRERDTKDEERSYIVNLFTDAPTLEEAQKLAVQILERIKDLSDVVCPHATTITREEPVLLVVTKGE